eukprot:7742685-Pyramimonas_sp.AAC.1
MAAEKRKEQSDVETRKVQFSARYVLMKWRAKLLTLIFIACPTSDKTVDKTVDKTGLLSEPRDVTARQVPGGSKAVPAAKVHQSRIDQM